MRKVDLSEMPCPIARSLDVIGEWWTLVIVRDALRGATRFEDFRQAGISDNILSARLRRLVEEGVFERHRYQEHPERFEYHLTEKGRDLMTVIGAIALWGIKWTPGPQVNRMIHDDCGHGLSLQAYCEECNRVVPRSEVRVPQMPHSERAAV
jgi:DNA-binding HxlR family transcriptional regulator